MTFTSIARNKILFLAIKEVKVIEIILVQKDFFFLFIYFLF